MTTDTEGWRDRGKELAQPTGYLDIGPLAGEHLLAALLEAIGAAGPAGVRTVITSGSRPLAVITPPEKPGA